MSRKPRKSEKAPKSPKAEEFSDLDAFQKIPTERDVENIMRGIAPTSFLAKWVRWQYATSDAPLIFALFSGLQALECVCHDARVRYFGEMPLNLYTMNVGGTGDARKTYSIVTMRRMVKEAKILKSHPTWNVAAGLPRRKKKTAAQHAEDDEDGEDTDNEDDDRVGKGAPPRRGKKKRGKGKRANANSAAPGSGQPPAAPTPGVDPALSDWEDEDYTPDQWNPYGFLKSPSTSQGIKWALSTLEDDLGRTCIIYREGEIYFQQQVDDRMFRGFYLDIYDGEPTADLTKGKEHRVSVNESRVSLMVGATVEHIQEFMSANAWAQGIAGRFLWAFGEKERRYAIEPDLKQSHALWVAAVRALAQVASDTHTADTDSQVSQEMQQILAVWDEKYTVLPQSEQKIISRRTKHAAKLCKLLAINERVAMNPRHAQCATKIVHLANLSALYLARQCPNSPVNRIKAKLLGVLRDMASQTYGTDGRLKKGTVEAIFTQQEIYRAMARVEEVWPDELERLLDACVITGEGAWVRARLPSGEIDPNGTDRFRWKAARTVVREIDNTQVAAAPHPNAPGQP